LKLRDCYEAGDWGYVIEASIVNPLHDLRFPEEGKLLVKLDTGFSGPVLVTADVFEFLRLSEIEVPEDMRPSYGTMAGVVIMRSAPGILEVDGKQIETDILTPLVGLGRILVGFQVLKELDIALMGRKACFVALDSPTS
jgi:predicted aspartyl protease